MTFAIRPFGSSSSVNRESISEEHLSSQEIRLITIQEQVIEGNEILSAFHHLLTTRPRQSPEINAEIFAKTRELIIIQRASIQESRKILSILTPSGKENSPARPFLIATLVDSLKNVTREFSTLDRTLTPLIQ